MRVRILTAAALLALAARPGSAQATQCASAPTAAQDACYMAIDLFQYVTPQLGISMTGGNVILSQGGTSGGLPHFTVGARVNVVAGSLPKLQTPSETGPAFRTSANPYPTIDQYVGLPAADASIGVFRGFPVGFAHVGGVDVLLSAAFVPTVKTSDIAIEPDSPLKIGYGIRLGLIEETVLIPGVALNVLLRDMPTTTILATLAGDSLMVTDYALKTMSLRATASKSFVGFTIAAGVGQDTYDGSAGIEAIVNRPVIGRVTTGALNFSEKITRMNYFANVALNILLAKLVAEGGVITGGDITTSNVFDISADTRRIYGSVGIRIGF